MYATTNSFSSQEFLEAKKSLSPLSARNPTGQVPYPTTHPSSSASQPASRPHISQQLQHKLLTQQHTIKLLSKSASHQSPTTIHKLLTRPTLHPTTHSSSSASWPHISHSLGLHLIRQHTINHRCHQPPQQVVRPVGLASVTSYTLTVITIFRANLRE
ncbi:hypothetical protein PGTUg99_022108 [Puccinia graminis f. sp. tritici]|uniref:Uncharacterized protein n=1 Tax=Puccinia graminis f. sp. tritici TaxID=56615 RepID=A0A5B0S0K2_PUCGR|nr:hypothetical protein PGTUg99_022108 [Puccinia graminis f. sp. tritici]